MMEAGVNWNLVKAPYKKAECDNDIYYVTYYCESCNQLILGDEERCEYCGVVLKMNKEEP